MTTNTIFIRLYHEALHVLGFGSLIDANRIPISITARDSIIQSGIFSRYDQYLYSIPDNDYLIAPTVADCCDAHDYQLIGLPEDECNQVVFRNNGIDIASVRGVLRQCA